MHPRRALLLILLAAAGLTPAMAATRASGCGLPAKNGHLDVQITSGSQVRDVRIFLPGSYDGTRALPLVFDLHGSNGSGADQAINSDFAKTADKQGFAVAWPDGGVTLPAAPDAHYWNIEGLPLTGNRPMPADAPDDIRFISDAIDQLAANFCIDVTRVYAAGHSGGGRMSSLLACRLADRIAAVAPVVGLRAGLPSATDPARPDPASCKPSRAVPIITFHGTDDLTNPYAGGGNSYWQYGVEAAVNRWAELNGCGATPVVEKIAAHVERRRYVGCRDNVVVEFNRIDAPGAQGGGHTWPGSPRRREPPPGAAANYPSQEISASERIWEFFSQYRL
jgi:polyhydroxybutyrate depolymerase